MAKITSIIPPQNFELIRDRIGAILTDEINNQYILSASSDVVPVVWVGRVIPFDKTDIPAINISLSTIDFDNKDQLSVDGANVFDIDVYTSAPFTEGERGDKAALLKCHRIIGLCRAILENPIYKTLDFDAPFNGNSWVANMRFFDPVSSTNTPDATNQTVGRIEFNVRCVETVALRDAIQIQSSLTNIKLHETDEGYYYEYIKPDNIFTNSFTPQFS